jgi:agmatine deiminase
LTFRHARYGDVWLRDTGPVFVCRPGELSAARFGFDGWGGKYVMDGDTEVARRVMAWSAVNGAAYDLVLEGGAIEVDGEGMLLTTKQCLLGAVRNPLLDARAIESRLRWALGVEHIVWLDQGLPNREALEAIIADLQATKLEVVTVPSPGAVEDASGNLLPASYMNFYIANTVVVVPTYGVPNDDKAVLTVQTMFPTRRVVGLPARGVVVGGGAFHCCTLQQPSVAKLAP